MELNEIIAMNIKKYRKIKGITQCQLAEDCQTSTSYIGFVETNQKNPQIKSLTKIAKAFGIETWELLVPDDYGTQKMCQNCKKRAIELCTTILKGE